MGGPPYHSYAKLPLVQDLIRVSNETFSRLCCLATDSLMVRISECISGGTRALYSALVKMNCKSCLLCLLLMGSLSILCTVNSCNTAGYSIKPWYLYPSPEAQDYLLLPMAIFKIKMHLLVLFISLSLSVSSHFFPPSVLLGLFPLSPFSFSLLTITKLGNGVQKSKFELIRLSN